MTKMPRKPWLQEEHLYPHGCKKVLSYNLSPGVGNAQMVVLAMEMECPMEFEPLDGRW